MSHPSSARDDLPQRQGHEGPETAGAAEPHVGALFAAASAMWLQATVTREDLIQYLDALLPLRISLDEKDDSAKVFHLDPPRHVELVPGEGLLIDTSAHLVWPVLGIHVPATIRSVRALFVPRIEHVEGEPTLSFGLAVQHLDLSLVPGVVESAIVDVINSELAKRGTLPAWRFTKTLDFSFDVPRALGFAGQLRLAASWADVKVTEDGFTLAMSFRAGVDRSVVVPDETSAPQASGPDGKQDGADPSAAASVEGASPDVQVRAST